MSIEKTCYAVPVNMVILKYADYNIIVNAEGFCMADAPDRNQNRIMDYLKDLSVRIDLRAVIILVLLALRFLFGLAIRKARMKKRFVD